MTTVQITLPEALAKEAANAGLLAPERIEGILREQLRVERVERLNVARQKLASNPIPAMTMTLHQNLPSVPSMSSVVESSFAV